MPLVFLALSAAAAPLHRRAGLGSLVANASEDTEHYSLEWRRSNECLDERQPGAECLLQAEPRRFVLIANNPNANESEPCVPSNLTTSDVVMYRQSEKPCPQMHHSRVH